ncbi:MAG: tetratricopeptide repeat protein [Bacillota bacterium]
MANLWLWFPNAEERRQFLIDLLGLKARNKAVAEMQEEYLSALEAGKTRSPWYHLESKFYMNINRDCQGQTLPFQEFPVWEKGFRRIYTQNSYYFRPGFWLVLKLRDNRAGRLIRKHVEENFPEERLGTNVPLPRRSEMFLELRRVRWLLKGYSFWLEQGQPKPKLLDLAYDLAEEIVQSYPDLFKGDDTCLWEDMYRYWESLGELEKAIRCLVVQAHLQPGKTDAWLNLGALYYANQMWGPATEAYLRGLRFDPEDRYIQHNLSLILENSAAVTEAKSFFNTMVGKYPNSFNLLITGDLHRMLGETKKAAGRYHQGILRDRRCDRAGLRCCTELTKICLASKDYDRARWALETALVSWSDDIICLELAVELYSALEELGKLKKYARMLVRRAPNSVAGHRALGRCYLAEGDTVKAREHATRARELSGK